MIRFIACLIFVSLWIRGDSQFGVSARYHLNKFPDWNTIVNQQQPQQQEIFSSSYEAAVDYWLRLPERRVEFYPEISFSTASAENFYQTGQAVNYSMNVIGAGMNIHLYPFDFFGDCACPTFSKQGTYFQKGFFIRAGVQAQFYMKEYFFEAISDRRNHNNLSGNLGIGAGFDFGLSNLITLTPFVMFRYSPSVSWTGFAQAHGTNSDETPDDNSTLSQWQFGIRIGFRPDYKKF